MEQFLANKNVMITGGTTGIGRAAAVLLASHGANVFIFGRHERELNDALSDIQKISGRTGFGGIADVTDENSVDLIFKLFDQALGRMDVFINNAGQAARSIKNVDSKTIKYVVNTNLTGYLVCAKMALERMESVRTGHIINIGSLSAFTRDAKADLYIATKAGVDGFNESLRKMISPTCIKVSIIHPGSVGTDLVDEPPAEQREDEEKLIMLKAEDVAQAIIFCLMQPPRVEIIDIRLRGHRQVI